jgi:hypothetical protein
MSRLYIINVLAFRRDEDQLSFSAKSILTVQQSPVEVQEELARQVQQLFPSTEGWSDPTAHFFEVPLTFETDGYRVNWHIEPLSVIEPPLVVQPDDNGHLSRGLAENSLWRFFEEQGFSLVKEQDGTWSFKTPVGLSGGGYESPDEAIRQAFILIISGAKRLYL